MPEVVTSTRRLDLCVPTMDDVDTLATHWSDAETMRYIGKGGTPWSRAKVAHRIERAIGTYDKTRMCFFTIRLRETGEIVGQGGLVPIAFNGPETELGYRLGRAHWGKGYATEIARASAAYGFETLGLDRLVAVSYPENIASRKVLTNAGFTERGLTDRYYQTTSMLYQRTR